MIFKSEITVSLEINLSKVSANRPCCSRPIVTKKKEEFIDYFARQRFLSSSILAFLPWTLREVLEKTAPFLQGLRRLSICALTCPMLHIYLP